MARDMLVPRDKETGRQGDKEMWVDIRRVTAAGIRGRVGIRVATI